MKLLPLQPMSHSKIYMCGDVTIHPSAVIAPGVLLQAEPDSRIIIAAGACIGMGTILHAYEGTLEIGESANLGTGVLVVGPSKIGAHVCVGSSTTIFNANVPQQQVLPAGSLLGDTSRPPINHQSSPDVTQDTQVSSPTELGSENASPPSTSKLSSEEQTQSSTTNSDPGAAGETVEVYGRSYVNELLVKLMPHKQQINQPQPEN